MPVHRLRLALVLLLALVAVAVPSASAETSVTTLRVLFVGNSLTQTNDLPQVVAALASAADRRLEWRTVAFGGFNLADHWQAGVARTALAEGGWDVVVLQQGPSALPESQADLLEWATRFADGARAKGTRPALFTVWPESYRQYALPQVIASYRQAAAGAHAAVLPGRRGLAARVALLAGPASLRRGRVPSEPPRHLHRRARGLRPALPGAARRPAGRPAPARRPARRLPARRRGSSSGRPHARSAGSPPLPTCGR